MAIVRKPGSILEKVLPRDAELAQGEQTIVELRMPDEGNYRRVVELLSSMAMDRVPAEKQVIFYRDIFSQFVHNVRNLRFDDGTEFVLERDDKGSINHASMAVLMNIAVDIAKLIGECGILSEAERKNS